MAKLTECQCSSEYSSYPHGGKVREYKIKVDTQPSGHGSFTIATTVKLCEKHRTWFKNGHVNLAIEAVRRG